MRSTLAILWLGLLASVAAVAEEPAEQLVVFVDRDAGSAISRQFAGRHLPEIEAAAARLGLPVEVVDVGGGAPEAVRLTPLLVYQSPRGRSFFQGRYADAGKVAHFVRTSRAVPPMSAAYTRRDTAVWQVGRVRMAAPIKITELAGSPPAGHDGPAFEGRARAAVHAALERFAVRPEVDLGPSDRLFYFDFYPYRSADGRLYVSTALFSQFNCIDPIFRSSGEIGGEFDDLEQVFAAAARQLEAEVGRQVASSEIGDGFDPLETSVPVASWRDLGLELPRAKAADAAAFAAVELPRRWRIAAPAEGQPPRLTFRFPAPLDRYSGEARNLRGGLTLEDPHSLAGARGWVEVPASSVTMGEDSLDKAVHDKMIRIAAFPTSRFDLERIDDGAEPLAFGRPSRIRAAGSFELVGRRLPIEVDAELEPLVDEAGAPLLRVRATYQIRLQAPFGILGPDGPAPANDTLVFYLDFLMEADSSASVARVAAPFNRTEDPRS